MPQLTRIVLSCFLFFQTFFLVGQDTVAEVKIEGNKRTAEDSIRYRISVKVGEVIDPNRVTQDIKVLWQTGLFQNVGVTIEDGDDGKVLTYVIRELPLITEVDFRGYSRLTKSTITDKIEEERLTIPEDTPLDYRRINAIRTLIKGLLDEKGLRYGTVDYKLEYLDATAARVVFDISEGSKVRIYDIEFSGNDLLPDGKLRKTMRKIRRHWMFSWLTSHDIFKEEEFSGDVDLLKEVYWKRGYKDVFVGEPAMEITDHTTDKQKRKNVKRLKKGRKPSEDKRMKLSIPIYEGRSYVLGNFTVEGNTVLRKELYQLLFPVKPGETYDLNKINEWIESLEETHNNLGYVQFGMEQDFTIRQKNIVDVNFKVNENDQVYVNRLKFSGNTTTRDKVIRREVLLREGDVFRLHYFRNSLLRVNQLGFFDITHDEPDVRFLPGENKVDIEIKGQESGVNELNFGLGFSEFRGSSGFLSFSTLNFLGKGEKVKLQTQIGSITSTYDISFTEPWLFDKPRGLTTRIFNTTTDFEAAGFRLESTGFQLGLSFRPTIFSTYSVRYSFSKDSFPSVTSNAFKPVDDLLTSSITQSLVYNTTDHPFFPKKGRKGVLQFELAGWQSGGDNFFYKIKLGGTQYLRAFKNTFVGFNVEGSVLETLEGQRPVQHQLFWLGGEESVRGYDRRSLGPAVEGQQLAALGDKLFKMNFEYIIPVSDQFRFVIFYDAGMIFGIDEEWFETDLARSTGVEMRFSLPVFQAPLRLMYAFRLDDAGFTEKGGDPKFSIGTTF